jgi:crotonobetainyl-CoA:carnitine CoA-transferase CaiB-like acyl-CoA transferase
VATLNAAGVPSGPVHAVADVFADPQIQAQDMVLNVEQPGHGVVRMLGFPMKFTGTPSAIRRPAPDLGQHSDEVLAELGFSAEQCRTLRDNGVI